MYCTYSFLREREDVPCNHTIVRQLLELMEINAFFLLNLIELDLISTISQILFYYKLLNDFFLVYNVKEFGNVFK